MLPHEEALVGSLIEGTVEAVFRWGIIVDLGLSRVGLIDALYIDDDDSYEIGDQITGYLDSYDELKEKFIIRPPKQESLTDRLRRKGYDL